MVFVCAALVSCAPSLPTSVAAHPAVTAVSLLWPGAVIPTTPGGPLLVPAYTHSTGHELWAVRSGPPTLIADVAPGNQSSSPAFLKHLPLQGVTIFAAQRAQGAATELFVTDADTTTCAVAAFPLRAFAGVALVGDTLVLSALGPNDAAATLWTAAASSFALPGACSLPITPESWAGVVTSPSDLVVCSSRLFFAGTPPDGSPQRKLFVYSGPVAGGAASVAATAYSLPLTGPSSGLIACNSATSPTLLAIVSLDGGVLLLDTTSGLGITSLFTSSAGGGTGGVQFASPARLTAVGVHGFCFSAVIGSEGAEEHSLLCAPAGASDAAALQVLPAHSLLEPSRGHMLFVPLPGLVASTGVLLLACRASPIPAMHATLCVVDPADVSVITYEAVSVPYGAFSLPRYASGHAYFAAAPVSDGSPHAAPYLWYVELPMSSPSASISKTGLTSPTDSGSPTPSAQPSPRPGVVVCTWTMLGPPGAGNYNGDTRILSNWETAGQLVLAAPGALDGSVGYEYAAEVVAWGGSYASAGQFTPPDDCGSWTPSGSTCRLGVWNVAGESYTPGVQRWFPAVSGGGSAGCDGAGNVGFYLVAKFFPVTDT